MNPTIKMTNLRKNSWIFIRGLIREQMHWDGFVEKFSNAMDANVTCIDLPGAGIYFKDKSPSTIEGIVDHVESHIQNVPEQSIIMAHSMGCVVAMEWMRRNSGKFRGAIFTNTSVAGICPMFERLRPSALLTIAKIGITHKSLRVRETSKFRLICANESKRQHSIDLWIEIQKKHPVGLITAFDQLRAAKSYQLRQPPKEPILLLGSLGDRLVNPACSERIAKAWNRPIDIHPWGGHDLFHDDPDWVIEKTKQWLLAQNLKD